MRARTVAVAAAVVAAVAIPAVSSARNPAPHPVPAAGAAVPAGRMIRPGVPVHDAPRPAAAVWRTSVTRVSSVTAFCFGHYARIREQDVWFYGEVVDGATGRRGRGWLWAGDLPVNGSDGLPYC